MLVSSEQALPDPLGCLEDSSCAGFLCISDRDLDDSSNRIKQNNQQASSATFYSTEVENVITYVAPMRLFLNFFDNRRTGILVYFYVGSCRKKDGHSSKSVVLVCQFASSDDLVR